MSGVGVAVEPGLVLSRVRELLGSEGGRLDGGRVVAAPTSDEEAAILLRAAGEAGWRVLPAGAGIGHDLRPMRGAAPGRATLADPELILSSERMVGILEHEPADLILRARAGTTLSQLQEAAAGARQFLALDPPGGGGITLGGIVATGAAGALRILFGRPRDQLLGLTMVDGAGRVLALGGRVVKNVAGFDLVRLAAGSRGTLGFITEVTFRLYPLPDEDRTLVWSSESLAGGWTLGRRLATLALPFASAELLGGRWESPMDDSGFRVVLRLTGSDAAVRRMREALLDEAGYPLRELEAEASRSAWEVLTRLEGSGRTTFRVHTLPSRGEALVAALGALPLERIALHLLQGSFRGELTPSSSPEELTDLGRAVREVGGTLRVLRAPGALSDGIEVDADAGVAAGGLPARIASGFDPLGILPGSWREGWG